MSITRDKWSSELCRVEEGIFFPDDSVILLSGNPRDGYVASARGGIGPLLRGEPEGWAGIDENPACRVEAGGVVVTAGATSWEGEGFVAAWHAPDGTLLWVLHLKESEAFSALRHDGEIIEATSGGYPDRYRWRIPVSRPELLSVIASRAT